MNLIGSKSKAGRGTSRRNHPSIAKEFLVKTKRNVLFRYLAAVFDFKARQLFAALKGRSNDDGYNALKGKTVKDVDNRGLKTVNFLSTDFGLKEFNVKSKKERIRRYRRYVYEAGSINQPEKGKVKVIKDKVLEKERDKEFELSKSDRFRYRTRYFTDSGIIGSKEFVSANYQRFKNLFSSKHEKKPKPVEPARSSPSTTSPMKPDSLLTI